MRRAARLAAERKAILAFFPRVVLLSPPVLLAGPMINTYCGLFSRPPILYSRPSMFTDTRQQQQKIHAAIKRTELNAMRTKRAKGGGGA